MFFLAALGRSWGGLGRLWAALGLLFGSWAILGRPEAILHGFGGPFGVDLGRFGLIFCIFWNCFCKSGFDAKTCATSVPNIFSKREIR